MKGSETLISYLNGVLCKELTAINQYFLHSRMMDNWGLAKLAKLEYEASIDEMKHADEIIKRILFLEGLPNIQKYEKISIGENIQEVLQNDLETEYRAVSYLKEAIKRSEEENDFVTRDLFGRILASEEHHIDWLETQLSLLKQMGLANYLQSAAF